jgi:hypothetical protein
MKPFNTRMPTHSVAPTNVQRRGEPRSVLGLMAIGVEAMAARMPR